MFAPDLAFGLESECLASCFAPGIETDSYWSVNETRTPRSVDYWDLVATGDSDSKLESGLFLDSLDSSGLESVFCESLGTWPDEQVRESCETGYR